MISDPGYPLSVLLDVFSWLQRQSLPCKFLLVLTGLPTLFPKLNEARTYTERMFHVLQLERLNMLDAHAAIVKPIEITHSPLRFSVAVIDGIIKDSGGYPYFIQFMCKEVFDTWITKIANGEAPSVPSTEILAKLDQDFFASRWDNATDRQQEFMKVCVAMGAGEVFLAVLKKTGPTWHLVRAAGDDLELTEDTEVWGIVTSIVRQAI